ncbi:MAG: short-chain fatty acyl-CoA regulator family protein [Pelagimonas sp.]|jgi:transcriptional regulator with XRE-family HTH domain|nr:short-chain fatty acyl-CoA regulator family protein [Pelagimonas sp.]
MPRDTLTGSRIREKRVAAGLKQADLARQAGISASYLNLIEHNRRRIGGKLLLDIAEILKVEPALLTEGAGAALISTLREAASDISHAGAEVDRVDEFAGRFPGWAQLLAEAQGRIGALERTVETLTDRMAHDPHLAASLHEMLSTVTSIHSSASILAEPGDIDPDWQARFHRNIHEDSGRLADTSRALVAYLESENPQAATSGSPQEELDTVQEGVSYAVEALETGQPVARLHKRLSKGLSATGQDLLEGWLKQYERDVAKLTQSALAEAIGRLGADPVQIAQELELDPALVMRRLAAMPAEVLPDPVGLAICDGSGVLRFRKPLPDFPMPRFGAACPLWPLYAALTRPMSVISRPVIHPGRTGVGVWVDAIAVPAGRIAVNEDAQFHAHMLVRSMPAGLQGDNPAKEVGVSCRICPRQGCEARAERSILPGAA